MKYILLTIISGALLLGNGCTGRKGADMAHEHDEHAHDAGAHAFTIWQDSLELFGEWDEWIAGQPQDVLLHLTDMHEYRAVESGMLTVSWLRKGDVVKRETISEPARAGIFDAELTPPPAGVFDLEFHWRSAQRAGRVVIPMVAVYGGAAAVPQTEHAHDADNSITFLKEQQWLIPFRTAVATPRALHNNIRALGELKAAQFAEADVFAPLDGVLLPDPEHGVVRPGQNVKRGDVIAQLIPHGGPESGWSQLVSDYRLAKIEFERVARLAEQNAVSTRRLQEARVDFENKATRLRGVLGDPAADLDTVPLDEEHFHLRAPASGVLADFHLRFGQRVQAGEHLVSIINPDLIWLVAHAPVSESAQLKDVRDAYFILSGSPVIHRVRDYAGELVGASALLDPATRQIPVIFELHNRGGVLRPGSFAQVFLKASAAREAVAIPESALVDEEGTPVAYVQTGGESFEKRVLQTGVRDEGFVEVLRGLAAGERVVTEGAYKVRLASISINPAEAGHGHAH